MDKTNVPDVPRRRTIKDRIEEARELFRRENYRLPLTRRRARANSSAVTRRLKSARTSLPSDRR
jgi:hypothetical protein